MREWKIYLQQNRKCKINSQIYFVLCQVLDIGCGTGGSAFYMARNYGVDVYGFDLSTNMIGIAQDYRSGKKLMLLFCLFNDFFVVVQDGYGGGSEAPHPVLHRGRHDDGVPGELLRRGLQVGLPLELSWT